MNPVLTEGVQRSDRAAMAYYSDDITRYATVEMALNAENVDHLKKLTALLPTTTKPTRKANLVGLVLEHLEGDGLKRLWSQLDGFQQSAISEVVYADSSVFQADRFVAKYGKSPNFGTTDRWGYDRTPSLLGLFFYRDILPEDLKARFKEFVPPPPSLTLKTLDGVPVRVQRKVQVYDYSTNKYRAKIEEVPVVIREMEQAAQHEITAVLRLISAGKLGISDKTLQPTATTVKAITGLLYEGDFYEANTAPKEEEYEEEEAGPIRAQAWPLLVQGAKLAELSAKKLALTKTGQKALTSPPAETLKAAWEQWQKNTLFDEFRRIDAVKGQTGRGKTGMTAPRGRRDAVVLALKTCPVGAWVGVDDFMRYIIAAGYDFDITRDEWSLYVEDPNYGSLGQAGNTWSLMQGRYILCLLFEYVATLGMIDVAYTPPALARSDYSSLWGVDDLEFFSRYDGLLAFRINALGAYELGLTTTYTPAVQPKRVLLRVLPNRDVVVIAPPLPGGDVILLNLFAAQASEGVWHLDQAKTLAALEEGHLLSELRTLLTERSEGELPATVTRFLDETEERGNKLRDRGICRLIECNDPHLLLLLTHDPRTKSHCFAAGERHLVVPASSEAAFRKALRQLGYILPP